MINKKYITFTFISICLVVLYLFALPVEAIAQIGCCQNPAGNCVPGQSNDGGGPPQTGNQQDCEDSLNGTGVWFPGVICVSGNDCPGAPDPDGCCVIAENDCDDNVLEADCAGIDWVQETACSEVPICNVPPPGEGCCVLGENNCVDNQTDEECNGIDWVEETACSAVPICNVPPPGEGCCVISENNCVDNQTESECDNLAGEDWVEETDCDFVPVCNVPPPGEGCCVLGPEDCVDSLTDDQCDDLSGDLVPDTACSGVPECIPGPILSRPIPTISQWGMIAMAGLLAVFSLILLNRRRGYKQM